MKRMDVGAGPVALTARVLEAPDAATDLTTEVLFSRHFSDVYRMVGRLLGPGASDADIEDVVQQVFLQAHRALPRFRGESKVSTWLYGIATRVVMTQLRSWRRQRRLERTVEAELESIDRRSPEASAAEREELARAWQAILRIKPKKRVVYVLFEIEGKSGEEIAALLEIPVATVWTRLHHARRELAKGLARAEKRRGVPA